MLQVLFTPETTLDDAVFLVNNPEVLQTMGVPVTQELPGEKKPSTRRFTFEHLRPGLEELHRYSGEAFAMDEEKRGPVEKEALRLYENILAYNKLRHVFFYSRDLPGLTIDQPEVRKMLNLPEDQTSYSYMDLLPRVGNLTKMMQEAVKIEDMTQWTPVQEQAFRIASFMHEADQGWAGLPLTMLPEAPHGVDSWLSPFDALSNDSGDRDLQAAAVRAGEMARAWVANDWEKVTELATGLTQFSRNRIDHIRDTALTGAEARFNRANYFGKAKVFYIIAFLLSLGAFASGNGVVRKIAWIPLGLALLMHVVGIAWRIYLTARPPVTNLYGTFLFVGLICMLLALLVEFFQKDALGQFAGSFIAITFLFLADRFGAEGDTMNKVVAVLASNFWLSTHVLAVTTGYAGVWIAGVFGHIWLVLKLLGRPDKTLESVRLPMEGLLGFGLTFAFLGTMLGGVWADQSWGRFWGWDPKENGALLIVLWTAAVYHARVAGMIRDVGTAAGTVIGCIMVMIAWLGVNLLSVGLHSYGFTDTMKALFYGYIAFEAFFLAVVLALIHLKGQRLEAKT
jgi:ABC-type transport system involved in cytochrome c biogenesis permease subunit